MSLIRFVLRRCGHASTPSQSAAALLLGACALLLGSTSARGEMDVVTYKFSHFAGSTAGAGHIDGTSTTALLQFPLGVCRDASGNIYVATSDHTIRKVAPDRSVSTLAGAPWQAGAADGQGAAARFSFVGVAPMAIDRSGNILVPDANGIRVVTTAGSVSTRHLTDPSPLYSSTPPAINGLAINGAGEIYVSCVDQTLRLIDASGSMVIISGSPQGWGNINGPASSARYSGIGGVAFDPAGDLYILDSYNQCVRKLHAGTVSRFAGSGGSGNSDGPGTSATFTFPNTLCADSTGNLYVGDGHAIRKITPEATVSTLAGNAQLAGVVDGAGALARFGSFAALAAGAAGELLVGDTCTVRRVGTADGTTSTYIGRLAVAGSTDGAGENALFTGPTAVALDSAHNVYVADTANHTIRKITPAGVVTTLAGSAGSPGAVDGHGTAARFTSPSGIAVDAAGNVYVVEPKVHTVRKISPSGDVTTLAGQSGVAGSVNGVGFNALFNRPIAVTVDAAGNVLVADQLNYCVRKIAPDGTVTTFIGVIGQRGPITVGGSLVGSVLSVAVDASGRVFMLDDSYSIATCTSGGSITSVFSALGVDNRSPPPNCIVVDAMGNVTGISNVELIRYAPDGTATVSAGSNHAGCTDGFSSAAEFAGAYGGAADSDGTLYIADAGNNAIRKGVPNKFSVPGGSGSAGGVAAPAANAPKSRLVNIATRAYCASGNSVPIGGFVITGNRQKTVLIRAVGPSLTAQGLSATEVLADPQIEVHQGSAVIAKNDDWSAETNAADITATAARIGATKLDPSDTRSSGLLINLDPGVYSFIVSGKGAASGVVLLEVYDADTATDTGAVFANIATRARSADGNRVTIGGFVIGGTTPKRLLVRATGPTLSSLGLSPSEVLPDPTIEVHHGAYVIAQNDNWSDNLDSPDILATAQRVGATALAGGDGNSSALLLTLAPGAYSFIAQGAPGSSGVVLLEVYDAD